MQESVRVPLRKQSVSPEAIKLNELFSIRREIKNQMGELLEKSRRISEQISTSLPKHLNIPHCEFCGQPMQFLEVNREKENITFFCAQCDPHE